MSAMPIEQITFFRPTLALVPPAQRSRMRLTRRGRGAVFVAALVALLGLAVIGSAMAGASSESGAPVRTTSVLVTPGDSLWSVAARAADGGDVLAMEDTIKDLNGLDSEIVQAGQVLRVPA